MAQIQIDRLDNVDSVINFTGNDAARPAFYVDEPEDGVKVATWVADKRTIRIYDVRAQMEQMSLDDNGFCFTRESLPTLDFFDAEAVRDDYYPLCVDIVKRATGASRVVPFDHNVRDKELSEQSGVNMPVRFAHNDYTDISAPQRVHDLLSEEADELLERRYMFVNVWRPLRGPVVDTPLAVCDATSLEPGDYIPTDLKYRDRTGEIFSFRYNANQRWIFLRDMAEDEVLLLKCFDSDPEGPARYTAHSAFRDPRAAGDVPVRRSIEVRTMAFF